jgi:group I intron endonuclease
MEFIYVIENNVTGKFYIGRTNNPASRKRAHFSELRRGVHKNPRLQYSFDKHGETAFEFKVVDSAESEVICNKEAEWFKAFYCNKDYLYNCHFETFGGPKIWKPHTPESAAKISEAIKNGTRKYIFDILDERYAGASLRVLAKKYEVGANTLLDYTPEWEQLRGLTMPKSVQEEASKQRVAEFVRLFMVVGDAALYELKSIGVSRRALTKYLPDFGLSFKDINLTKWRDGSKQKALDAIKMVNETGCTALHAMKECGATVSSYYKYRGV